MCQAMASRIFSLACCDASDDAAISWLRFQPSSTQRTPRRAIVHPSAEKPMMLQVRLSMSARCRRIAGALLAGLMVAGCATQQKAEIRVNMAPDANLSAYGTFGFPEQAGTDRGGYSTIITNDFKAAVTEQMQMRGYRYVDSKPDLLVNFYANVREHTEVRSRPPLATGYYGYRYGLYDAWPLYPKEVETVSYPVGTANIDIVDARRRQLIWEGVAQGRISDKDMEHPREVIAKAVAELFAHFPGRARAVDTPTAASGR
jgi:hypothetical protein